MALQADNKWHCKVTHYENGRVITRRIHSLAIQATDGRLYTLTEKKLPDAIALFTGESHSGEHMAEVLMNPKPPLRLRDIPKGWPEGRDLMHVVIGFLLLCGIELLTDTVRSFLSVARM